MARDAVQAFGVCRGALHPAGVRRNDRQVAELQLPEVIHQHGSGEQVIHRHVEVALKLAGVQVERQHPVHPGRRDEVSDQLRRNGHPGPVLAVLPSIAEIRNHRRDARRRGPPTGIGHNQQFHEMMVDRIARRLDQENVLPADILLDLGRRPPRR